MSNLSNFVHKYGLLDQYGYTAVHATIDFLLFAAIAAGILKVII